MSILLLGAGNMGASFLPALIKKFNTSQVYIVDTDLAKLQVLQKKFDLKNISTNPFDFLDQIKIVLLATKPQTLSELAKALQDKLKNKLLVSIMAGVSIAKIQQSTGAKKVIRCMPNLAVSVKNSVIGYLASPSVKKIEKETVKKIFETLSYTLELESEAKIDEITAISGSGPAYYFYLTEILKEKALEFGFNSEQARNMAEKTLIGAAELIKQNNFEAKEWKQMVTSKGGTTEAALISLEEDGFDKIFKKAIQKAKDRAVEIGS